MLLTSDFFAPQDHSFVVFLYADSFNWVWRFYMCLAVCRNSLWEQNIFSVISRSSAIDRIIEVWIGDDFLSYKDQYLRSSTLLLLDINGMVTILPSLLKAILLTYSFSIETRLKIFSLQWGHRLIQETTRNEVENWSLCDKFQISLFKTFIMIFTATGTNS